VWGARVGLGAVAATAVALGLTVAAPGHSAAQGGPGEPTTTAAPGGPTTAAGSSTAGPAASGGAAATGRFYFLRDCAYCHGADAAGTNYGPSLRGVGRAAVDFWVSTGRMPLVDAAARDPKTGQLVPLTEAELADAGARPARHTPAYSRNVINAIVDYVGSIAPGGLDIPAVDTAHANVAAGGEVYRLECAACHSWAGTGGALLRREAPGVTRATPVQVAEAIRTGPEPMPAFGTSAIPDDELNNVVAYVRYLAKPNNRGGNPLWYLGPVAEGGVALIGGMGALLLITRWIGEKT